MSKKVNKLNKMGKEKSNTKYIFDKSSLTYGDYGLPFYGAIQNRDLNFPNARLNQQNDPLISVKYIINPRIPYKKNSFGKIWYPNMYLDLNYNPKTGGYVNANGPIGPYFAQGLGNYPRSMFKEVYFGADKRPRTPEKEEPEIHIIDESSLDSTYDEYDRIEEILNDPDTKVGDIIKYQSNNQLGGKTATIIRDRNGNKKIGSWRYDVPDDFEDDFDQYYFGKKHTNKGKVVYCLPKQQKFPVNTKKKCSAALSYARYAPDPCKIARCVQRNCKKYPTVGSRSKLIEECNKKSKTKNKTKSKTQNKQTKSKTK